MTPVGRSHGHAGVRGESPWSRAAQTGSDSSAAGGAPSRTSSASVRWCAFVQTRRFRRRTARRAGVVSRPMPLEGLMRLRNAPGLRGEPRPPWRPPSGPGPGAALGATRSAPRTARRTGAMAGAAGPRGALWDGHVVRAGSRAGLPQWAGRRRCSALSLPTSVSARSSRSVRFNAPAGSFLSVVAPETANWVVSPVAPLSSVGFVASFSCGPLTLS